MPASEWVHDVIKPMNAFPTSIYLMHDWNTFLNLQPWEERHFYIKEEEIAVLISISLKYIYASKGYHKIAINKSQRSH